MKTVIAILVVLLLAAQADACQRCGFLRSCRFAKQAVIVKPAAIYPQASQTINVANIYPVGATQYASVQSATSLYATNPAIALTAATETATRSLATMESAIASIASNNHDIVELAKVQAATQHLQAALATTQETRSYSLRITQSAAGIKVEQMPDAHGSGTGGPEVPVTPGSLLDAKCAKCHGVTMSEPKAGLYFGSGEPLDATAAVRALRVLDGHDVPSAMTSVVESLTADELSQLRSEIISLWRKP